MSDYKEALELAKEIIKEPDPGRGWELVIAKALIEMHDDLMNREAILDGFRIQIKWLESQLAKAEEVLKSISEYGQWGKSPTISIEAKEEALAYFQSRRQEVKDE